jgi:hypothetical protein
MNLEVKPIPVPLGFNHPEAPGDILPRHEFTLGIIAPKDLIRLINVVEKQQLLQTF